MALQLIESRVISWGESGLQLRPHICRPINEVLSLDINREKLFKKLFRKMLSTNQQYIILLGWFKRHPLIIVFYKILC
jgi:hypothetical protein